MAVFTYQARELFNWLINKEDIVVLDVRNDKDFKRFKVESPYPFEMLNVSYYDFMELEEESVARLPGNRKIRVVCSQEGSAKYVAEILHKHGFDDVGYLSGGIKNWGNLLVPKLVNPGMEYELYQFIRPGKASCSYGLIANNEIMFFDPSRAIDFYQDFAREKGCTVIKTFETHLQADYIAGSRDLATATGAEFFANDGDFKTSKNRYSSLVDGDIQNFSHGGPDIRVLFTPGHTPGSTTFIIDEKFMISGDMVFIRSIGRPDLGGKAAEWSGMLFDSISMIKEFDDGLIVLPAHYIDWDEANGDLVFALPLGDVKKRNEGIYAIDNLEDFKKFIQDNIRPQPKEYALIRLANANIEQYDEDREEELDLGKNECAASAYAASKATKAAA